MESFSCDRDTVVDLSTHRHGPGCGHERVAHDDHYDYVGDDGVLHHLLEHVDCCEHHANVASDHNPVVVSHGHYSKLLHRHKSASASSSSTPSPAKRLIERSNTMCMGSDCALPCCVGGAPINFENVDGIVTKIYCEGVCCPMEIPVVEAALHRIPGVISVEVAVVTRTVTAKHVPSLASPAALVAALQEARLGASLTFPRQQNMGKRSWLPPWYVNISVALLIISLFHYLAGPLNAPWLDTLKWIALGPVALCLPRIALKAIGALRNYVLDIHFLITLAAAGAIAIGDYSEASVVVVLFCIADFLEERCTGQARDAISAVLALKPDNAVLAATGEEVPAVEVPLGTFILIRAGDKAPLDGVVVTGTSAFDESVLTGESVAVVKHPGDTISAGTMNAGSGLVSLRTTATSDETFVAGMARLVEQATSRQSPAEAAVAKFAKIYTPIVVISCILLAFIPWSDPNADRKWWVYLSLQVLVTACPCALVLSTPVTIISALARAAQVGVLIKGGVVLETLRDVKVVTLDKTGTLTVGAFLVDEISTVPESDTTNISTTVLREDSSGDEIEKEKIGEKDVLRMVGSLERGCNHPLAAALVGRAAARGVACDAEVHGSSVVPGFGIMGIVDGHAVRAGTAEFIRQGFRTSKEKVTSTESVDENRELAQLESDAARFEGGGVTTCFIAVDGQYVACITARDSLRPEAAEAIASLRSLDITPAMLTGDNASVARAIGVAAGIEVDHIHAALLPQDKLDLVSAYNVDLFQTYDNQQSNRSGVFYDLRKLFDRTVDILFFWRRWGNSSSRRKQFKIRVAHVGDGVNDAPALAAADVGISMGVAGAAAALEAGDVALFTNDLRVVPALQRLARAAGNKILFNITIAVVTKIIVLVLAAMGKFSLFGAVLVDVGSALLVTLNGLTLLRWDFGLGESPAGCVGAAAAAAAASAAATTAGQCCSNEGCCAAKPEKEIKLSAYASSACKSKGCCSITTTNTNKGLEGGKACCDVGAEMARPASCCGHQHHHDHEIKQHSHNKSHREDPHGATQHNRVQKHSHAHGNGKSCGHRHEDRHIGEHSSSFNHSDTKALLADNKSCCSSHTHH